MSDEELEIPLEDNASLEGAEVLVESGDGDEPSPVEIPEFLPVLPLKNTVLFPFLLSPLLVRSERSKLLIDAALLTAGRLLLCVAVKGQTENSPGPDDVHWIGTVIRIAKMMKFPDDSYRLLVQGVSRAQLEGFTETEPFLSGRIRELEETGELDSVETTALVRNLSQQFAALVAENSRLSAMCNTRVQCTLDSSRSPVSVSNRRLYIVGCPNRGFLDSCSVVATSAFHSSNTRINNSSSGAPDVRSPFSSKPSTGSMSGSPSLSPNRMTPYRPIPLRRSIRCK
ncbi:MAG: LON peptidase substrate-binding domain-containing protein [Myxococcales bacterium]|nr:LON peptidase substrate-binding domain-containing protein [Myxococcales bacterium]